MENISTSTRKIINIKVENIFHSLEPSDLAPKIPELQQQSNLKEELLEILEIQILNEEPFRFLTKIDGRVHSVTESIDLSGVLDIFIDPDEKISVELFLKFLQSAVLMNWKEATDKIYYLYKSKFHIKLKSGDGHAANVKLLNYNMSPGSLRNDLPEFLPEAVYGSDLRLIAIAINTFLTPLKITLKSGGNFMVQAGDRPVLFDDVSIFSSQLINFLYITEENIRKKVLLFFEAILCEEIAAAVDILNQLSDAGIFNRVSINPENDLCFELLNYATEFQHLEELIDDARISKHILFNTFIKCNNLKNKSQHLPAKDEAPYLSLYKRRKFFNPRGSLLDPKFAAITDPKIKAQLLYNKVEELTKNEDHITASLYYSFFSKIGYRLAFDGKKFVLSQLTVSQLSSREGNNISAEIATLEEIILYHDIFRKCWADGNQHLFWELVPLLIGIMQIIFNENRYLEFRLLISKAIDIPKIGHYVEDVAAAQESIFFSAEDVECHPLVISLATGNDAYKDFFKNKTCNHPFSDWEIGENGKVFICCPSYLPTSVGNLFVEQDVDKILNSELAVEIQKSIVNQNFRFCRWLHCKEIDSLPRVGRKTNIEPNLSEIYPIDFRLSYDTSCNLWCVSCRNEKINVRGVERDLMMQITKDKVIPLLKKARSVMMNGYGDVFSSKPCRLILQEINVIDNPMLQIDFITNIFVFCNFYCFGKFVLPL